MPLHALSSPLPPRRVENLRLDPFGESLDTNPSECPRSDRWKAPCVVGKLESKVYPPRYTLPASSTRTVSISPRPRSVEYRSADPVGSNSVTKAPPQFVDGGVESYAPGV